MRRLTATIFSALMMAASLLVASPRVQAQVTASSTTTECQPFDVTFVMDNSGSMDDHGSNDVLFDKLVPRLKDMFVAKPIAKDLAAELITFSYYSSPVYRVPVAYGDKDSMATAVKRVGSLGFGADDSKIGPALKKASEDAHARFETTSKVQIVIVAGDEQTDEPTGDTIRMLKAEKNHSKSPYQSQAPGVKYYTFALNNDGAGRYKDIAFWTGGQFYNKKAGDKGSDGFGYESFYNQIINDICNMKVSIDGRIYNSTTTEALNGWNVALYEEGVATPRIVQTVNSTTDVTNYHFTDLNPMKKYQVVAMPQSGWNQTTPNDTFATPLERPERNFGFQRVDTVCIGLQLLPSSADYKNGDVFTVQANVTNKSSRSDKAQLTIPALSGIKYLNDVTPVNAVTTSTQPNGDVVLTTTQDLVVGQTKTLYWRYQADNAAAAGERYLSVVAKLLNCSGTATDKIRINVLPKELFNYDLNVKLDPAVRSVAPNDTISYGMTVSNVGSSNAANTKVKNAVVVPKGMNLQSLGVPGGVWSKQLYDATRDQFVWEVTLPADQKIDYTLSFSNALNAAGSPYTIQASTNFVEAATDSAEVNKANNTTTAQLNIVSMTLSKVWTDTNTTEARTVGANANLGFTVKVTNNSGSAVTSANGYYLVDYDAVVCDQAYAPSCGQSTSDQSVTWTTPSGTAKMVNGRFVWGPIAVNANGVTTYTLTGKTADAATLQQKITTYGPQQRCNNFAFSDSNGVVNGPATKVCWTYDLPADLSVTKTFLDGTKTKTIKQGDVDGFVITVKNNGQYGAVNSTLTDTIFETNQTLPSFVKWSDGTIDKTNGSEISDRKAQWDLGTIAPNETKTVKPGIAIFPCNDGKPGSQITNPVRRFTNMAIATTDSRDANNANNTNNNDVSAVITYGYYNLILESALDKTEIVRSEPGNDTVVVTYRVKNINPPNNPSLTINMAVPAVTVRAGLPTDSFDITLSDNGRIENGKAVWDVGNVGMNQTVLRTATLRAKAGTPAGDQIFTAEAISASANSQRTCGYDQDEGNKFTVKLAGLYTTKALPQGASKDIELGKSVSYDISVVNNSGVTFSDPFTLNDTLTTPMSFDKIESCVITNDVTRQQLGCGVPQVSTSGQTISWSTVVPLQPKTTLTYRLTVKTDPTYQPASCPIPIDNSVVLKNGNIEVHRSAPATISLYATRCFNGNIYAQTGASGTGTIGVDIRGSDVIVDSNSIVASKNGIQCTPTNNSCSSLQYKIQDYGVNNQLGSAIAFATLKARINRSIDRLKINAEKMPDIAAQNWQFDLQGDPVKFPQGRIWKKSGDLTINGPLKLAGRGTIIVEGNLNITGSSTIEYCNRSFTNCTTDSSAQNAVGFMVTGNITVGENVTKMVGAYVAPQGTLTFNGSPAAPQLRPAKGMFIANKLVMNRPKIIVIYDAFLNTPQGAPPGFTFTASPSETQEGS